MASVIVSLDCRNSNVSPPVTAPGAFGAPCFFSRGEHTFAVPLAFHATNRAALLARLGPLSGLAVFRGGDARERFDTDHEELFRQESYFQYLFGVKEPGWWGVIDVETGEATLLMPQLAPEYAVWMGRIETCAEASLRYGVRVVYVSQLGAIVAKAASVFVMKGVNSDSGTDISDVLPVKPTLLDAGVSASIVDESPLLFQALAEARVHKSSEELNLLAYVSYVSSLAHVTVMRSVKAGDYEYQLEARFLAACSESGGCRNCAYTAICACGPNSAVLHYGHAGAPNDKRLSEGDVTLLDMGAEYHCYASDITCSFPVRGTFDADQRMVYEGVLAAQKNVLGAMKPGASWADMHLLAEKTILDHLVSGGVLVGAIDDLVAAGIGAVFLPCGLGHFIGLDTHDVGGYLPANPPRSERNGLKKLRTARVLAENMVLTVEPGIYFIDALLDPATAEGAPTRKFFDLDRLADFRGFGGVRLEDVVAVTENGVENYTLCPRTCDEVEAVMRGEQWPPATDAAPYMFRKWTTLVDSALVPLTLSQSE
ncbi:peptidase M24, structural domain-containing protein [Pelagophyceae sp. CCMP2097]|nr:peptidase M24, structural domain-containing protein [Pelagophyceae sp. CCMP2097]